VTLPEEHEVENEEEEELETLPAGANDGAAPEDTQPETKLPIPSALLAFASASLVSVAIILLAFLETDSQGCDGGLCAFIFLAAFRHAVIAWFIVFPVAWLFIAAVRRS
jgi:hypothetical protein